MPPPTQQRTEIIAARPRRPVRSSLHASPRSFRMLSWTLAVTSGTTGVYEIEESSGTTLFMQEYLRTCMRPPGNLRATFVRYHDSHYAPAPAVGFSHVPSVAMRNILSGRRKPSSIITICARVIRLHGVFASDAWTPACLSDIDERSHTLTRRPLLPRPGSGRERTARLGDRRKNASLVISSGAYDIYHCGTAHHVSLVSTSLYQVRIVFYTVGGPQSSRSNAQWPRAASIR
ncbi:hypothetical protein BD626DRAFT_91064 [Schizophyllum amplum]|uniref:Uncharacterized protein n=1 Tax=Schizophyllum amplum TaxID=97359 RepID=A0A550C8P7_9AGAR|nr:hypothetical protein BD626DRAFT_91064 [Auriculariopsis ampla]